MHNNSIWCSALMEGAKMASALARECEALASEYAATSQKRAAYWRAEAARHYQRAEAYISDVTNALEARQ